MSIPSTERMTAIADKGAQPTSVEVNWALRQLVEDAANRLDLSEKSTNSVLTLFGRFERACFRQWLAWLDLPDTRHQLTDVVRIVEAMEHDLLRNPPREEVAAVIPMRDALMLYRVACGWLGREPRVTELGVEEKLATLCGQHFGSEQHPNRYVCELPDGHEGLHAAPSVPIRQHAEPVRMEMLGGGLMAEIGPVVIGEEIARQLNAGIEPATGKGAVNADLKMAFDTRCGVPFGVTGKPKEVCALRWDHSGPHAKGVIRTDDLPEPTQEELEAYAKELEAYAELHEEIVEKMTRLDPDEVRRALESADHRTAGEWVHIADAARAWLEEHRQDVRRQFEILNEVATWAERFCTSGRYEPQMTPQRGLYRALLRLQAVRTGCKVPPPYPEPDENQLGGQQPVDPWQSVALRLGEDLGGSKGGPVGYYSMSPEKWLEWALGCLRDLTVECEATDPDGVRFCHHKAAFRLCNYHGRVWEVVEAANGQLARLSQYIASQPVSRFPGIAGRDVADVVIDALRASGEQREGVLLEAKPAQDPETTRLVVAAAILNHLMSRMHHPDDVTRDTRDRQADEALAWADALIERSRRAKR